MLKGENIICISSIDWDFIWQGHQEIMSTFAKAGNRVLFIETTGVRIPKIKDLPRIKKRIANWFRGVKGIRKIEEGLYVLSPIVLPFPYSRIARRINRSLLFPILERWMRTMGFNIPIIWTFLPNGISLDVIDFLPKKLIIYYCIDNFAVSSSLARKIKTTEDKLLKKADLVFVTSKELSNRCSKLNNNTYLFPFGVNITDFEKIRISKQDVPKELVNIKRPIVGYIGGVHKWIDQKLVRELAEANRNYSFVFVGPLQTDVSVLENLDNIYFLGHKHHYDLPKYVESFDVCIIPYLLTEYTKNVYPTKLNEYLAMGKPVISTRLPEVEMFNEKYQNAVYIGKDAKEFSEHIRVAIDNDCEDLRKKRISVSEENSWERRIEEMSNLAQEAIVKRSLDRELKWKENLLIFYHQARRKLVRVGGIGLLIFLLLFKTPLIFFLAKPLKITDTPQRADAIVVFAGGVGESGKAGQGYEERVQYAVQLYKDGYAPYMIFSSGYTYALQEAEVMKALAISLGISPERIILEKQAANTYENVKFVSQILNKKGWHSILLVSSPYHMKRTSLVFRKVANNINLIHTPIPYSLFYDYKQGIQIRHIRGLLHECLGIIYYYLKGHI